jgi:hypothetical protein
MINQFQENSIFIIHLLSLIGDLATIYFNNNNEVVLLGAINSFQHLTKILRIIYFGFLMVDSPSWFCYLYSFINYYTNNTSLTISCLIIFTIFAALIYPTFYADNYQKLRPYVYGFVLVYNAIFELINLYEPVLVGYSPEKINESFNCSSGYRYRLYQYILGSTLFNIPFNLMAIICTGIIFYKVSIASRKDLKKQITTRIKMSFGRSIKIICFCGILSIISFFNLYNDIINGVAAENGNRKEEEEIGKTYVLTACSGIFIFIFTNSLNQIKRKLGMKVKDDDSVNDDTEYMLPLTQEYFDDEIYSNEKMEYNHKQ